MVQIQYFCLDARTNMVPYGYLGTQDRETDMNVTMSMNGPGIITSNPVQEFTGPNVFGQDWRQDISHEIRNRFVYKMLVKLKLDIN